MARVVYVRIGSRKGRNNLVIGLIPKVELFTKGEDIDIKKENMFVCIIYVFINKIMIGKDITCSKFSLEKVNNTSLSESDYESIRDIDCPPSGVKIIEGEFAFTMDIFKLIEKNRKINHRSIRTILNNIGQKKEENDRNVSVNAFVKLLYTGNDGQLHMIDRSYATSEDYIISSGEWICMMNSMGFKTIKTMFEIAWMMLNKRFKSIRKHFPSYDAIKSRAELIAAIVIILTFVIYLLSLRFVQVILAKLGL